MTPATIVGWVVAGLACTAPEPDVPAPDETDVADAPSVPDVDPREQARALAEQGEAAFTAGRYDEASEALRQAYDLEPVPLFLFAWARSEQEAGRCEEAIELYQRFIATAPPASDVDRANLEVGRCYGALATDEDDGEGEDDGGQEPTPPPPDPTLEPDPDPDPDPDPRSPRAPWLRDPWGGVLLATGIVGVGVGAGLYARALADQRRAMGASTTDEFREASTSATRLSGAGIAGLTVGSALLVGAVVRYVVVARRKDPSALGLGPLGLHVRF